MNAYSVQAMCETMQDFLLQKQDVGMIVIDSSTPGLNATLSHSILTQTFRAAGDGYDRLFEIPTFGHSKTHAGLQIADILPSGLVVPVACRTYCVANLTGTH